MRLIVKIFRFVKSVTNGVKFVNQCHSFKVKETALIVFKDFGTFDFVFHRKKISAGLSDRIGMPKTN